MSELCSNYIRTYLVKCKRNWTYSYEYCKIISWFKWFHICNRSCSAWNYRLNCRIAYYLSIINNIDNLIKVISCCLFKLCCSIISKCKLNTKWCWWWWACICISLCSLYIRTCKEWRIFLSLWPCCISCTVKKFQRTRCTELFKNCISICNTRNLNCYSLVACFVNLWFCTLALHTFFKLCDCIFDILTAWIVLLYFISNTYTTGKVKSKINIFGTSWTIFVNTENRNQCKADNHSEYHNWIHYFFSFAVLHFFSKTPFFFSHLRVLL